MLDKNSTKILSGNNTKLLATTGIAHNIELDHIKESYNKIKPTLPVSDKYLAFILSGNIYELNDQYHCYNNEEIIKLANYISNLAKEENYTILLTNGPSTEDYNCKGDDNPIIDDIIFKFKKILEKNNVSFKIINFYEQKNIFEAIIGTILHNPNSTVIIPGEFIPMISVATELLPQDSVAVYHNSTLNTIYKKYLQSEFNLDHISIINDNMYLNMINNNDINPYLHVNIMIAKEIYNLWKIRKNID